MPSVRQRAIDPKMRRVCPGCRATYEESVVTCPRDGLPLLELSRTFAGLQPSAETVGPEPQELDLDEDSTVAVTPGMMVGEYMIERTIAEGGMGAIYAGIHPVISKRVAIKVINKRYAADPKAVARFVLEARSVNQIGHHNIVDIFSIGELDDRRNFMVMELLDGLSLSHILLRAKRLSPGQVLPVYEQLCDALEAAHSKGFIHRDLKPDNVVVLRRPPRPFIKILDFGLAKLRGAVASLNTEVGTVLGTPEYMAPEQCRGAAVDARTDIYALGVVAYELLTGVKPFTDPSPLRILSLQQHKPPLPPSRLCPIGQRLEQIILRALAKSPEDRYPSVKELITDLRRAIPEPLPWPEELVVWSPSAGSDKVLVQDGADTTHREVLTGLAPLSISGEIGPLSGELEDEDSNQQTLVSEPVLLKAVGSDELTATATATMGIASGEMTLPPPGPTLQPSPALLTPPPGDLSGAESEAMIASDSAAVVLVDRPIRDARIDGELTCGETMVAARPGGDGGSSLPSLAAAPDASAPARSEPAPASPPRAEAARRPSASLDFAPDSTTGRIAKVRASPRSARRAAPTSTTVAGLALVIAIVALLATAVVVLVRFFQNRL